MEGGEGSEEVWLVGKRYGSGRIWVVEAVVVVEVEVEEEERKMRRVKREAAKMM